MQRSLPMIVLDYILAIHAFLGCDTVPRIHSMRKIMKKITANEEVQSFLANFSKYDAIKTFMTDSGERSFQDQLNYVTKCYAKKLLQLKKLSHPKVYYLHQMLHRFIRIVCTTQFRCGVTR